MRTMKTPTRKDADDNVGDGHHCIVCGKKVNKARMWAVHLIDGGDKVLHPDDEHLYQSDAGEMGSHSVGSECRKQFGEFAVKWF